MLEYVEEISYRKISLFVIFESVQGKNYLWSKGDSSRKEAMALAKRMVFAAVTAAAVGPLVGREI